MADAPTPPPPPRPGDPIPAGGLDPSMVFAAPPTPPPPPPSGAAAGGQGQQAADPGPGKPPPPSGTAVRKEDGYDDEDVRISGLVGNYRFGSVSAKLSNDGIAVPSHPETTFDEQGFLTLLRGSISLTKDEKWRIIQAIPKLSQFQIDELFKILREEKRKFSELSPKHLLQLMKLEQKHSEDWKDLQSITAQQNRKEDEEQKMQQIRKQMGL